MEEREISQTLEQPHPETGKKPFEMGRDEFVDLAQKDAQEGGEDLTAAQALDVQRSVVEKAVESGKEVPPQIIEELGEAPAGEADISFEPGEFERPEPVGNLADLTPEEFSRRFPKASPEVHKASVRQALLIGKEVPKESLGAYRDVVEDLEREGRQEALEKEEKELIQAGKTPLTKFVVERGGINIAQAYKAGFRGELENVRRPGVMRRKGGSTISNMSETAFEAGVIPEKDEILFLNRLDEESRPSGVRERIEFRRAPKEKEHEDILKAKKRFGTTDLFEEAGYITPDGSLLDFSGKKQGGQQGTRELDHREVNFVVSKSVKFKDQPGGNTAGMRQFMSYGNIRFSPVSSGLELSRPPTFSQLAVISRLVRERNGEVTLDVVGDDGNGIFSREYPKGTDADEIVEDINRAFGQEAVSESKIAYGTNDPAKIDRIISETSKEIAFTPQQLELEFESSGIPGELRLKGFVDFRGTPVKNIRQVAEVIASLRHPKLEYFQVVFVKNGKVVGHQVFSTGLPNAVLIPDQLLGDILAEAKKLGAEVYLGHNHPSGNHLPSAEDRLLTRKVAEGMKGNLKGHIVTDDKNFSFIKSDGTFEEIEYLTPKPELKKFGGKVQDRDSAALIAKKHSDGKSTLVLLASSRHDLIAVETVPEGTGIEKFVMEKIRSHGASNAIVVYPSEKRAELVKGKFPSEVVDVFALDKKLGVARNVVGNLRDIVSPESAHTAGKKLTTFRVAEEKAPFQRASRFSKDFSRFLNQRRVKAGSEVTLRQAISEPTVKGGRIPSRRKGKVLDVDLEGGILLVDFEGTAVMVEPQSLVETYLEPQIQKFPTTKQIIAQTTGITPQAPTRELSEMELLKAQFLSQAKGAKIGARAAAREVRGKLLESFRTRLSEIEDIRRQITDYAIKSLPMQARGGFLVAVRDAKTPGDLAKAFRRIDIEAAEVYKKSLIEDIKILSERTLDSPGVDVGYKERIRELLSGIELQGHRQQTLEALKRTQEFIDREQAAGKDVDLPREILDRVAILARKPVDEVTEYELERVISDLGALVRLGRSKVKIRRSIVELQKERILKELIAGTTAIEKNEQVRRKPGEILDLRARINRYIASAVDFFQHINLAIMPMDPFFDLLDGSKGYSGPNYIHIKKRLDGDFGRYLDLKDEWIPQIEELADKLQLNTANFERIGVHSIRVQKGGREHLQGLGLKDEEIDAIKLTPTEMRLYSKMREVIEIPFPKFKKFMADLYNKEVEKVENYFPFQTDFEAMSEVEVFQRLGDSYEGFGKRTKKTPQGFAEKRVGGKTPIKVNALDIFKRHMDDMAYLLEMQSDIKMLSEVANTEDYAAAAGDEGTKRVLEWLDLLARNGGKAEEHKKWMTTLDIMRRNFGATTMGFKLSSIFIQPTSMLDASAILGGDYVAQGLRRVATSKQWRDFLMDNFSELRHRVGDDIAFRELSYGETLQKVQRASFWALQKLDGLAASASVAGAYQKALDKRGVALDLAKPDAEALSEASLIMRRTQNSPFFKDISLALSRGDLTGNKSIDKALFQFKSYMLNRWSLIHHDIVRLNLKEGKRSDMAFGLMYILMANAAETGIRWGIRSSIASVFVGTALGIQKAWDFDDERIVKDFVLNVLQNVPFMGDLIQMAVYHDGPFPALKPPADLLTGIGDFAGAKTEQSTLRAIVKTGEGLAGMAGIPGTSQAAQIAREWIKDPKLTFPFSSELRELEETAKKGKLLEEEVIRLKELRSAHSRMRVYQERFKKLMDAGQSGEARKIAEAALEEMRRFK